MASMGRIHVVDGVQGVEGRFTPVPRSSTVRAQTHGTFVVAVLLATSLGFGVALLQDSPLFAFGMLLFFLIATGIISVAWMRPSSASPEHHPKIDHYLDDSSP